jgi:hypothetical protein
MLTQSGFLQEFAQPRDFLHTTLFEGGCGTSTCWMLCGAAGVFAAARPRRTRLPGICWHTTGLYPFDRALSLMATWSLPPGLPQDSMPHWLSRRCCVGTKSPRKFN